MHALCAAPAARLGRFPAPFAMDSCPADVAAHGAATIFCRSREHHVTLGN